MSGAVPLYSFMVWTGATLLYMSCYALNYNFISLYLMSSVQLHDVPLWLISAWTL